MKSIKLIIILGLAFFIINDLYARKERLIKVGCVDLQKVFEKSPGKKLAEQHLKKMKEDMEKKKKAKEEKIRKLLTEYSNEYEDMSDDKREAMELQIQRLKMELRKFIDESNEKLAAEEEKLLEPLIEDIKDVIKAVSIKYGYNIILDKSTYILYVDKEYDITDEVLAELKVKYKEQERRKKGK